MENQRQLFLGFIQSVTTKIASWSRRRKIFISIILVGFAGWGLCLPEFLFQDPYSSVLLDRNGELLGARIAEDGQWRFPVADSVPKKFQQALMAFEDKRFSFHPGVDPIAMGRALWLNLAAGEIVSGGSTLTMQVIRMSRKGQARTVWQKLIEVMLATRLEVRLSKQEIMSLYAAHAPFGGNVVGLEAASWKYFGREAARLSWAESATLAVLPNAPALIHPGRNRQALLEKRNRLLSDLLTAGRIDSLEWELSLEEPLPDKPMPMPNLASHLLERVRKKKGASIYHSTLDLNLQQVANALVERHYRRLSPNGINNAAMLVAEIETGAVLAYVGNTAGTNPNEGHQVDVVTANRSTGSILKPFLYASMLHEGELLPEMLVADIPSYYGGFAPTNYDKKFHGAVPASDALARSLNIPAVRMLNKHGISRFYQQLKVLGLTSLFRPAEEYGLSLILGGAEATLWDLTGAYASMGRTLQNFSHYNGRYEPKGFRSLELEISKAQHRLRDEDFGQLEQTAPLSAGSIWHTFEAMQEVNRPGEEATWRQFGSSKRIAWKTGTSYGFRDAWSIGVMPGYVVAVWVGNADGEGRPGLIGSEAAAPLMFDMFSALSSEVSWFREPFDDLEPRAVCRKSGHLLGEFCPEPDTLNVPIRGTETVPCPYHQPVWLTDDGQYRIHSDCEIVFGKRPDSLFVLPAAQETFYRLEHPAYRPLPPWRSDCLGSNGEDDSPIALLYPEPHAKVFLPTNLDGKAGELIFEARHRVGEEELFWHLDETFLTKTSGIHQVVVRPGVGKHLLTIIDNQGNELIRSFEILPAGN